MRQRTIFSTESQHREYFDDLVDHYLSWREACAAVGAAYESWRRAARQEEAPAFLEYVAALNHEERMAMAYRKAVEAGQ